MGGNSAWKKRVANGGLAKEGTGGAIARHHPRMGRRGEDLKLNKKGAIAGGNPKKKKKGGGSDNIRRSNNDAVAAGSSSRTTASSSVQNNAADSSTTDVMAKAKEIIFKWALVCFSAWFYIQLKEYWQKRQAENPFPEPG